MATTSEKINSLKNSSTPGSITPLILSSILEDLAAIDPKYASQISTINSKINTINGTNSASTIDTLQEIKNFLAGIPQTSTLKPYLDNVTSLLSRMTEIEKVWDYVDENSSRIEYLEEADSQTATRINNLSSSVSGLQDSVSDLQDDVSGLKTKVNTSSSSDIDTLQEVYNFLQGIKQTEKFSTLRQIVEDNSSRLESLEDADSLQATQINNISSSVSGLQTSVSGLQSDVSGVKSDVSGLKAKVDTSESSNIDTLQEVYDFLSGFSQNGQALVDRLNLIAGATSRTIEQVDTFTIMNIKEGDLIDERIEGSDGEGERRSGLVVLTAKNSGSLPNQDIADIYAISGMYCLLWRLRNRKITFSRFELATKEDIKSTMPEGLGDRIDSLEALSGKYPRGIVEFSYFKINDELPSFPEMSSGLSGDSEGAYVQFFAPAGRFLIYGTDGQTTGYWPNWTDSENFGTQTATGIKPYEDALYRNSTDGKYYAWDGTTLSQVIAGDRSHELTIYGGNNIEEAFKALMSQNLLEAGDWLTLNDRPYGKCLGNVGMLAFVVMMGGIIQCNSEEVTMIAWMDLAKSTEVSAVRSIADWWIFPVAGGEQAVTTNGANTVTVAKQGFRIQVEDKTYLIASPLDAGVSFSFTLGESGYLCLNMARMLKLDAGSRISVSAVVEKVASPALIHPGIHIPVAYCSKGESLWLLGRFAELYGGGRSGQESSSLSFMTADEATAMVNDIFQS